MHDWLALQYLTAASGRAGEVDDTHLGTARSSGGTNLALRLRLHMMDLHNSEQCTKVFHTLKLGCTTARPLHG